MKGILASICALALLGASTATIPNDLYAHHHPDAVLNKNQVVNKNSQPQGNGRGGRGNYRQSYPPPSRNMYHNNPGRKSYRNGGNGNGRPPNRANYDNHGRPPNRANYGNGNGRPPNRANYGNNGNRGNHEPRSAAPVQKLSYNKDGSIKWGNKMAATSDQQQGQGQQQQDQTQQDYGQSYEQDQQQGGGQSQGQYNDYDGNSSSYSGNNGNSGSNSYYGGSNNNNQQQNQPDNSGQSNSYSGNNQGSNYYQEDQQQSSNQYYDQGNDDYSGDTSGYGYSNDNDYGSSNNNDYGSSNNNDYGNSNSNSYDDGNNQSQNSQKKNVTAGFAGGIRLAGALPDDGYTRGEGTFYDVETRVGSCGKQNENSELVAALNSEQMGEDGRNNANCGKDIEVVGPSGKSIQVTVVDSCQTCKSGGLDLSPAAFEEIGDFSHNSVPIKWKFV